MLGTQYGGAARVFEQSGEIEIGFLLVPGFPLMSLSSALDVIRHANLYAGYSRYRYRTYAPDGGLVKAGNNLEIQAGAGLEESATPGLVFVCAGSDMAESDAGHARTHAWLRRLSSRGVPLGGISAGSYILARAGLLSGHKCALHWYDAALFRENFPDVEVTDALYEIDRDRLTSSGGAATIDLMLRIVADDLGSDIAAKIAEMLQLDRIRSTVDRQTSASLYKARARSVPLARAIRAMEENLEQPLTMLEMSELIGLTRRQLHRLFRQHTGSTPTDFYRDLRLRHARSLLHGTPARIIDVAAATGFGSHSHFTKVYRQRFGVSPLKDRHNDL